MFELDWFVVVVIWSGVDNISFSYENELVWIWFGFVPICRLNRTSTAGASKGLKLLVEWSRLEPLRRVISTLPR